MEQLTTTENQLANTTINLDFIKELYHVNYLTAFPISDTILEGWYHCITEIEPALTKEALKWILTEMKVGNIEYNPKLGIQNIFQGFKQYINFKCRSFSHEQIFNNPTEYQLWQNLRKRYNLNVDSLPNAIL